MLAICGRQYVRPRHLEVVDRLGLGADDRRHRSQALVSGHVREPEAADDVADGVQVRFGGAHRLGVDQDDTAVDLGARGLQADVFDVGRAPGGDQHLVSLQLGRLLAVRADHERHATAGGLVRLDRLHVEAGAGDDVDATALEGAFQLDGHLAVLERHEVGQILEDA